MNDQHAQVSPLGQTLLEVAWSNDRHEKLVGNAALRLSLSTLQKLLSACKHNDTALLATLTGQSELPRSFLSFAAALANVIDLKLRSRGPNSQINRDSPSDFDHAVFLALGQALADNAWPQAEERDLRAPAIKQVVARLADCELQDVQVSLLQNYLGNVLQDYFDRAQARVAVRDLPDEVELEIRRDDCRIIAELAWQTAVESRANQGPPDSEDLQTGLTFAIEKILETPS
ncbi:MAG: hypothetical protein ACREA9_21825 [Pyrinomonadaceae bacterium]